MSKLDLTTVVDYESAMRVFKALLLEKGPKSWEVMDAMEAIEEHLATCHQDYDPKAKPIDSFRDDAENLVTLRTHLDNDAALRRMPQAQAEYQLPLDLRKITTIDGGLNALRRFIADYKPKKVEIREAIDLIEGRLIAECADTVAGPGSGETRSFRRLAEESLSARSIFDTFAEKHAARPERWSSLAR